MKTFFDLEIPFGQGESYSIYTIQYIHKMKTFFEVKDYILCLMLVEMD